MLIGAIYIMTELRHLEVSIVTFTSYNYLLVWSIYTLP